MEISILANQIIELRKINYLELSSEQIAVTEEKFNNLCKEYLINLKFCNEYDNLFKIVRDDWNSLDFPISLIFNTYQRLIEIKPRDENLFTMFIDYLLLYGPDWEEEAIEIKESINKQEYLKAIETVRKVDYYKIF